MLLDRLEIQEIRQQAKREAYAPGTSESSKRALLNFADAADSLDAVLSRAEEGTC